MIMKNCSDLIPKWMRFIKGIMDSNDIPLNISRDTIQTNRVMMKIEKLLIKKILRELDDIAEKDSDKFKKFWESFGPYIKEGIISDAFRTDRLLKFLRFKTSISNEGDYRSLEEYIKNIPETQTEIYYLVGENLNTMKLSPHLGYYNENNMEVILFEDPIDNFLMMNVHEYKKTVGEGENEEIKSYKFTPIDMTEPAKGDKESNKKDDKTEQTEEDLPENIKKFFEYVKSTLKEKIIDVKLSDRLYKNICRLANPAGGMTSSMQRAMRFWTKTESGKEFEIPRKIFEFNKNHPLFKGLIDLYEKDPKNNKIEPVITQLFENCLLAEGDLPNPSLMVPRINQLIEILITGKQQIEESTKDSNVNKKDEKNE